jgi:hypothetical protein
LLFLFFGDLGIIELLMLTLSARISSMALTLSAHKSVSYAHAQHVLKGPFQIWNLELDDYRVRMEEDDP